MAAATTTKSAMALRAAFTEDELRSVRDGLEATNLHFGPVPDPPTSTMTALAKVDEALGV